MKKPAAVLACLLVLAACGSTGDTTEKMSGQSAATVVNIAIKDGKVTPQGRRVEVKVGEPIELRVTSDKKDEVHVHSEPEHEYEVAAGAKDKEFIFAIDTPGQVAVESHGLGVTIVQLVVRA